MKNTITFSFLFTLFFIVACGDSPTQKSVENDSPTAKTVAEKIVDPVNETVKTQAIEEKEVAKEMTESTPTGTKSTEKTPVAKSKKQENNSTKQPTATPKTESVKSMPKVATSVETPKEITEPATKSDEPEEETPKAETPKKSTPDHSAFNTLLQKNVSSAGKVNYQGFKTQKADLQNYLDDLAANTPSNDWGRKETMAYWINAYNAYTIKLIVDNFPISSITKLENGKPWDKKWIKLGDKTYSLNNIENDILRPKYKDARIHFAVNCAAQSCPPILNNAWTADNLNTNFDKQAKAFINNAKFNKISANSVEISKIFEWYAEDFGNIIDYLNKYSTTKIITDAKVSYMEYDWALNN